jgi:hypothetical protein
VKVWTRPRPWLPPKSAFTGFRFPAEVIVVVVRWYLRYNLSYRDVEELLVERGVEVDHITVYRRVQHQQRLMGHVAEVDRPVGLRYPQLYAMPLERDRQVSQLAAREGAPVADVEELCHDPSPTGD